MVNSVLSWCIYISFKHDDVLLSIITYKCGSTKHSVIDDFAFLWETAIFGSGEVQNFITLIRETFNK